MQNSDNPISTQLTQLSPTQVELNIEVPWIEVEKVMQTSFQRVQRHAKVKGFRPGKVPPQMVKKLFEGQIRQEVTSSLVEQGLLQAIMQHQITPVSSPQLDHVHLHDGEPFKFKVAVEVQPKIEKVELSGLSVEVKEQSVSEEQVEDEIKRLQKAHADVRDPESARPANNTDHVQVDYSIEVDGTEDKTLAGVEQWIDLGAENILPELKKALIGSEVGSTQHAEIAFPADYVNEKLQGKSAKFTIQVKGMREVILPKLDDEFAKDCGDYENLNALRQSLRLRMETMAKMQEQDETREKIVDKLVELNPIPLPNSLVHDRAHRMEEEMMAYMRGYKPSKEERQKTHAMMHERAERQLRAGLVFNAIAKLQKLEVSEADIEGYLTQEAERSGKHPSKIRAELNQETLDQIRAHLLEDKIFDYLQKEAKVVKIKADATADEKPAKASKTKKSNK